MQEIKSISPGFRARGILGKNQAGTPGFGDINFCYLTQVLGKGLVFRLNDDIALDTGVKHAIDDRLLNG